MFAPQHLYFGIGTGAASQKNVLLRMLQVCLYSHQMLLHSRQIYSEYPPYLFYDNPVIPVNQHVAQASDLLPRNVRVPFADRWGNVLCGLTNYL